MREVTRRTKSSSGYIFLKKSLEDYSTVIIQKRTVIGAALIAAINPTKKILKSPLYYALNDGRYTSMMNPEKSWEYS